MDALEIAAAVIGGLFFLLIFVGPLLAMRDPRFMRSVYESNRRTLEREYRETMARAAERDRHV